MGCLLWVPMSWKLMAVFTKPCSTNLTDLDWPLPVGLLVAEPEQPCDGDGHEERLDEGGVVDELVNVVGRQHGQRDQALLHAEAIQCCTELSIT